MLCVLIASLGFGGAVATPDYAALWTQFKVDYGKTYDANGNDEQVLKANNEQERFQVFKANVDIIEETNAQGLPYQLGINQFADLNSTEFAALYLGGYKPEHPYGEDAKPEPFPNMSGFKAPSAVDWVAKGAVTPVKNQARCGSCWAFSTTGSIEGAYFVTSGKLVSLSEEHLVQCDHGSNGCQGGSMQQAFGWVKQNGGICAEDAYPYTSGGGTTGTCKKGCQPVVTVTSYTNVPQTSASDLLAAVTKQPVSIAVEADKPAFQHYKSGVVTKTCGKKLDHGVLVVGYGTDGATDYWKVKNSWGKTWGEQGYIRLTRSGDECGLLMQPTYPTGVKAVGPGPSPGPSPPPSPPGGSHYEDPSAGCLSDEKAIRIQGVAGAVCSPQCSGTSCPTDVPAGVTATPQCMLKTTTGQQYCALKCSRFGRNTCGAATCKKVGLLAGICTYNDDESTKVVAQVAAEPAVEEIVV